MRSKAAVVHSILGICMLFALSGCFLLMPQAPHSVRAHARLDNDGVVRFDYMPCIKESSYFSGRYYVLDGVAVFQSCGVPADNDTCPNGIAPLLWNVEVSPGDYFSINGVPLPQSLRYGEKIPRTHEDFPPMPLRKDTDYRFIVKITGFKGSDDHRNFGAVAHFRIESDGKGGLKLIQPGGASSCGKD